MAGFDIELTEKGAKEAARRLRKAGADMQQLKAAYKDMAGVVKTNAGHVVPVRSGKLKRSIRASATQRSGVVRAGRANLPYAGVINYGWPRHHIEATHFMETGLALSQAEVISLYAKAIRDALDQT